MAFNIYQAIKKGNYEQVVICYEPSVKLEMIVVIHNTVLGPSLGGLRMWLYANEDEAIRDCMRLARGMTYKAAAAGLDVGGGKSVVIADPKKDKTEALLRTIGKFVNSLNGRYIIAEDVGTTVEDMEQAHKETDFVVGLPESMGGGGDPSPVTAYGTFEGLKACLEEVYGDPSIKGKAVAVQGVGKVGYALARMLHEAGAKLILTDIDQEKLKKAVREFKAKAVSTEEIYKASCDVFAPCALGGIINAQTIPKLKCKIVAGSANNVLKESGDGLLLHKRGVLYAPDYVINAGGLINVVCEREGYNRQNAMRRTRKIYNTLKKLIARSKKENIPTSQVADKIAEARIEKIKKLKPMYFRR